MRARPIPLGRTLVQKLGESADGGQGAAQIVNHRTRHLSDDRRALGAHALFHEMAVLDCDRGETGQRLQQGEVGAVMRQTAAAVEIDDADDILSDGERQTEDRLQTQTHDAVGGGLPGLTRGHIPIHRPAGRGHLLEN